MKVGKSERGLSRGTMYCLFVVAVSLMLSACAEIQRPEPEPFYAETTPPAKQEFRWSNGREPKSFDPARAAAAPETDIVRALFEGLTDLDPHTFNAVPAAAESWASSPDLRVWTFQLRKDARWSNGEKLTAQDFVSSWKRLSELGSRVAHEELLQNIVGQPNILRSGPTSTIAFPLKPLDGERSNLISVARSPVQTVSPTPKLNPQPAREHEAKAKAAAEKFGVEAVDDLTLRVTLESPDQDFPKLTANTMFRPIYGDGVEFESDPLDAGVVTNGPFTVSSVGRDGIVLERSDTYWNKSNVTLERVRFVPKENAEAALTAYKKGEIDVLM